MRPILHLAAACLFLGCALAGTAVRAADACDSPATPGEANRCAAAASVAQNGQLDQAYAEARARLGPDQQDRLKRTQLAWLMLRESTCEFESAGISGGAAQGRLRSDCLTRMTRERLQTLRGWATCRPGAAGCAPLR